MVHWHCSLSLCFNNLKGVDSNGEKLWYHKFPKYNKIHQEHQRFFHTAGFDWKNGYICATHWSNGQ